MKWWLRVQWEIVKLFWVAFRQEASGTLAHRWHYAWNQSPRNEDFNPWISCCQCCCICVEDE